MDELKKMVMVKDQLRYHPYMFMSSSDKQIHWMANSQKRICGCTGCISRRELEQRGFKEFGK